MAADFESRSFVGPLTGGWPWFRLGNHGTNHQRTTRLLARAEQSFGTGEHIWVPLAMPVRLPGTDTVARFGGSWVCHRLHAARRVAVVSPWKPQNERGTPGLWAVTARGFALQTAES